MKSPSSTSTTPIPSDIDMTRTYYKNNRRTTAVGDVGCKGMFLIMASSTASVTNATLPQSSRLRRAAGAEDGLVELCSCGIVASVDVVGIIKRVEIPVGSDDKKGMNVAL